MLVEFNLFMGHFIGINLIIIILFAILVWGLNFFKIISVPFDLFRYDIFNNYNIISELS